MTPEEAREIIKQFRDRQGNSDEDIEALQMAIKALEQQNKSEIKIDCDNADCNNCVNHKYCDYEPNKSEILTGSESEDCISREAVKEMLTEEWTKYMPMESDVSLSFVLEKISELPSVTPKARWIPIKTRPMTEEEKEEIGHEYAFMYDCPLPDDGQDVLITDCYGNVEVDTFCSDYEGCYFETNCDDGEVIAWMPLPESYRGDKDGNINNKE